MPKLIHGSPLALARVWRYGAAVAARDTYPLAGDCTAPIAHEIRGRESELIARLRQWREDASIDWAEGYGHIGGFRPPESLTAFVEVRCRKCEACLAYRRRLWTARAIAETRLSARTWFLTLTFAPEARFVMEMRADKLSRQRRAERLEAVASQERFALVAAETGREVTKYLKRVRKNARVRFRYLQVVEAHKDGFPHYHLLIHEMANGAISKRELQGAWRGGFSQAKLVNTLDAKATGYVCKYLSKSAATRVRASQRYGRPTVADLNGKLQEIVSLLRLTPG